MKALKGAVITEFVLSVAINIACIIGIVDLQAYLFTKQAVTATVGQVASLRTEQEIQQAVYICLKTWGIKERALKELDVSISQTLINKQPARKIRITLPTAAITLFPNDILSLFETEGVIVSETVRLMPP